MLTGPERCRLDLLARHGTVVTIPHNDITVERVQSELRAFADLPLHEAYMSLK